MIVGCYSLHLYCANAERFAGALGAAPKPDTCLRPLAVRQGPAEFTGQTAKAARREARKAGWRFTRDDVLCPPCGKAAGL
jgi:hypothetical protein